MVAAAGGVLCAAGLAAGRIQFPTDTSTYWFAFSAFFFAVAVVALVGTHLLHWAWIP
jgi:hypothetical protein